MAGSSAKPDSSAATATPWARPGQPRRRRPHARRRLDRVRTAEPVHLVKGRAPSADDQVVIDAKSADVGKLAVGDTTTVLVECPPQRVQISGIARFGTVDSPGGATVVLFRRSVAQKLIAEPGKFDTISVAAAPGVTQQQLAARVAKTLPRGAEAVTGAAMTKESQTAARNQ